MHLRILAKKSSSSQKLDGVLSIILERNKDTKNMIQKHPKIEK